MIRKVEQTAKYVFYGFVEKQDAAAEGRAIVRAAVLLEQAVDLAAAHLKSQSRAPAKTDRKPN